MKKCDLRKFPYVLMFLQKYAGKKMRIFQNFQKNAQKNAQKCAFCVFWPKNAENAQKCAKNALRIPPAFGTKKK